MHCPESIFSEIRGTIMVIIKAVVKTNTDNRIMQGLTTLMRPLLANSLAQLVLVQTVLIIKATIQRIAITPNKEKYWMRLVYIYWSIKVELDSMRMLEAAFLRESSSISKINDVKSMKFRLKLDVLLEGIFARQFGYLGELSIAYKNPSNENNHIIIKLFIHL